MRERIARGRFPWGRVVVHYNDGRTVREDRSDEYWWDNLPKEHIAYLSAEMDATGQIIIPFLSHDTTKYRPFFHYKWKKVTFGGGNSNTEERIGIGIVTKSDGTSLEAHILPDGSWFTFESNVLNEGRNLELHGIRLEEIHD